MSGAVRTTWVTALLRPLPRPVRRLLDGWSHRRAQQKARERHERWARGQQASGS